MAPRGPRIPPSANNVGRTGSIRFRLATSSHSWSSFRPGQRKRRPRSVDAHWSDVSDTLDNRSFSSRPKWHPHQRSWRTTSHSLNDQALRLAEHPHVRSPPGSSCPGYAVAEVNQRSRIHLGIPYEGEPHRTTVSYSVLNFFGPRTKSYAERTLAELHKAHRRYRQ